MKLLRLLRHAWFDEADARRALGNAALARLAERVRVVGNPARRRDPRLRRGRAAAVVRAQGPRRAPACADAVRQAARVGHRGQQRRVLIYLLLADQRDRDRGRPRPRAQRAAGALGRSRRGDGRRVSRRALRGRADAGDRCRRRGADAAFPARAGRREPERAARRRRDPVRRQPATRHSVCEPLQSARWPSSRTPRRTAVISATIASAISGGVRPPMLSPTGPWSFASSSGPTSNSRRRWRRTSLLRRRAERADVERRRLQRLHQRQVVELRVVGDGDDGAERVEVHREHERRRASSSTA